MNKKTVGKLAAGRALGLVDIENLVGASTISERQVAEIHEAFRAVVKPGPRDQFYVAASHHNQAAAAFGWPNGQHQCLSGEDGADYLLVKKAIDVLNAGGYDHVYVATGDNALAPYVTYLMEAGIKVTIVAKHRGFSRWMAETGADIIWLDSEFELAA